MSQAGDRTRAEQPPWRTRCSCRGTRVWSASGRAGQNRAPNRTMVREPGTFGVYGRTALRPGRGAMPRWRHSARSFGRGGALDEPQPSRQADPPEVIAFHHCPPRRAPERGKPGRLGQGLDHRRGDVSLSSLEETCERRARTASPRCFSTLTWNDNLMVLHVMRDSKSHAYLAR